MEKRESFILTKIFGNTVKIKILEILMENSLKKELIWLNITEISKMAGISTSSSKRIIDELLEDEIIDLKPVQTHAKNPEREVRLNADNRIIKEFLFFYRKVKGFT